MLKKKHSGNTFLLVDQQLLGNEISTGRISIPFTEKNGVYSGPPANAQTAIEEFEKTLLTHNPRYLVFGCHASGGSIIILILIITCVTSIIALWKMNAL